MKIKRIISIIAIVCVLFAAVNIGRDYTTAAETASFELAYEQLAKYSGSNFAINLVDNEKTVGGIELFISYDADVITVDNLVSKLPSSWTMDYKETANGTYGSGIHLMLYDSELTGFADATKTIVEMNVQAPNAVTGNSYDIEVHVIDVCDTQGESIKSDMAGSLNTIPCVDGVRESEDVVLVGYQVSTTVHGLRTIATVEPEIDGQKVVEYGHIYGMVCDQFKEADMYVGSDNPYVVSYSATSAGIASGRYTESTTAINYVRTMIKNGSSAKALSQKYCVRAYAKLADGSYRYSKVGNYSIYQVADYLYQNVKMSSLAGHEYLYNNILTVVDSSYKEVDYDWGSSLVK